MATARLPRESLRCEKKTGPRNYRLNNPGEGELQGTWIGQDHAKRDDEEGMGVWWCRSQRKALHPKGRSGLPTHITLI